LTAAVHRVLCESGRTPLEVKTGSIVRAVEAFETGIDLSDIKAKTERVSSLKGLIGDFERELAESDPMLSVSAADRPVLKVLGGAR